MSTSTQAMSAQISNGVRSLRGSVGSSTAEAVSRHPSLRKTLAPFDLPASTTTRQLYELLSELDQECLRHATDIALDPAQDSTSEVESVAELAVFLSGPLSQCGYPGRFLFQEIQLRALIASLALLGHNRVNTLNPSLYDKLKLKNISARYQGIAFHLQRHSPLADKIRAAPNMYLVQFASQYASFVKRGDSPWPSIFGPTTNIFFSALALGGGQYDHIRDIIEGLNQIVNIWQKPQTKYQTLCGLQEYARLATSLCREAAIADESGESRTTAAAIVTSLVDKVDEILAAENVRFPPELARRWHKWLALISRGPPDLDQGYYYYGLLDCLSQLAAVSDPGLLGEGLQKRVNDLIFCSFVPEYRWKAIEILLSCPCTRPGQYQLLERDVRRALTVETEANILEEMRVIKAHLDSDEEEGLRFAIPRPLPRVSDLSTPTIPLAPEEPPTEAVHLPASESTLAKSRTRSSTTFSLSAVRSFGTYHSAGLFKDGRHAFFNNDSELSVYELGDLRKKPVSQKFSTVFTQEFKQRKHQEFIRHVASGTSCIIIATNNRLLTFGIDPEKLISAASHRDWDPSGLACHESETHLVVFLGQGQRNMRNGYNGQVRVFRYRKHGQAEGLPVFALNVPANDSPKRLFFDPDSQILTCITRTQNKVLVWKLDDDFLSPLEPFEFLKNKYRAETKETGVTSATIYRSPANRPYVLCTTAPSTERWHQDGEWSYILPIPGNASRSYILPGSRTHNFEQLGDHRALFAGCPSSQHHIFAVLEDSGRLSVLRLDKHEDGGIYSSDEAEILAHSLCKQNRPLPDCLRFDATGSCLFAVDPRGKIIVTEFEAA